MTSRTLKPVVFCDLDGTLLLDNSFHIFLAIIWMNSSWSQRMQLAWRISARFLGRLTGGHEGLKRRIVFWFRGSPNDWQEKVVFQTVRKLPQTFSMPVRNVLDNWREKGAELVIATAAPDIYAAQIAQLMGAECLATSSTPDAEWGELLGLRKAEACKAWLRKRGEDRHIVVLTDHLDDLPLMQMADEVYIQACLSIFDKVKLLLPEPRPRLLHIDHEEAQSGGGYWLWFDDRPSGPYDPWEIRTILSKHRFAQIYMGRGNWRSVRAGDSIESAVTRTECPRPPGSRQRLAVILIRRIWRDWLGVFH